MVSDASVAYSQATASEEALRRLLGQAEVGAESSSSTLNASLNSSSSTLAVSSIIRAVNEMDAMFKAASVAAEEEDHPHVMKEYLKKIQDKKMEIEALKQKATQVARELELQKTRKQQEERSKLLSHSAQQQQQQQQGESSNARREMLDKASLISKSKDVTATLRRTQQLVSQEVERMTRAVKMLQEDSKSLDNTVTGHSEYRDAAGASDAVLRDIAHQEKIDRLVLIGCFSIFLLVVIYIVWKRTIGWFI